jgi:hypothetical protein
MSKRVGPAAAGAAMRSSVQRRRRLNWRRSEGVPEDRIEQYDLARGGQHRAVRSDRAMTEPRDRVQRRRAGRISRRNPSAASTLRLVASSADRPDAASRRSHTPVAGDELGHNREAARGIALDRPHAREPLVLERRGAFQAFAERRLERPQLRTQLQALQDHAVFAIEPKRPPAQAVVMAEVECDGGSSSGGADIAGRLLWCNLRSIPPCAGSSPNSACSAHICQLEPVAKTPGSPERNSRLQFRNCCKRPASHKIEPPWPTRTKLTRSRPPSAER